MGSRRSAGPMSGAFRVVPHCADNPTGPGRAGTCLTRAHTGAHTGAHLRALSSSSDQAIPFYLAAAAAVAFSVAACAFSASAFAFSALAFDSASAFAFAALASALILSSRIVSTFAFAIAGGKNLSKNLNGDCEPGAATREYAMMRKEPAPAKPIPIRSGVIFTSSRMLWMFS